MARDEDLEKALESGDFINVGSLEDKEGVSSSDLKKISFDLKLPEYNDLIGIEFSKTIPPEAYLVSTQLLELVTDLPKIDKQKRYFLQSLLNELLLGNASKYKNDLLDYVIKNNIENILEINLKKINHNLSLTSLAITLAYILKSIVDWN